MISAAKNFSKLDGNIWLADGERAFAPKRDRHDFEENAPGGLSDKSLVDNHCAGAIASAGAVSA